MIVAELEIYHSRPIAPTRRIALGNRNLPAEPAPGPGGILLAGIIAHNAQRVDTELRSDFYRMLELIAEGRPIPQPQVRHRFQYDLVGLICSNQKLLVNNNGISFDFDDSYANPIQLCLGAAYAGATTESDDSKYLFKALEWHKPVNGDFIDHFEETQYQFTNGSWSNPSSWALEVLDLEDRRLSARKIQKQFNKLVHLNHPDLVGDKQDSSQIIKNLTEAKQILLDQIA